ncbi:MAG: phosphoenolpyruvate carboxykinase (ATP) [Deltaproteobacteria bacterium]|nr:phosphoenolpyruvate carboxykinase (ATP) [Deltaproteobacteria bacterium]
MFEDKNGILDLETIAQKNLGHIHRNLTTPMLYEEIIKNREGLISHLGPVVVRTGHHTERSVDDRYIVRDAASQEKVWWSGRNQEMSEEHFKSLFYRLLAYLQNKDIYVQDCLTGSDTDYQIPVRIVTETAWHALFARNMFVQIHDQDLLSKFKPDFTIVQIPGFQAIPELDGTHSSAFIIVNIAQKIVFIGGTSYAYEIKDAVFTVVNYLVSQEKALSLRCAANLGQSGDVAVFLGRSRSGKTTLATDPTRRLIGDDHHGWNDKGMFNYEWGCYAKIYGLDKTYEPAIYESTRMFGTILENVTLDNKSRRVDFLDNSLTDNTRAAYPITHIPDSVRDGICGHPKNIFMLTCDPFGVLPPLARLTAEQTLFTFLSSYKPSLSEQETQDRDARVLHNACFGTTPLVMKPHEYAKLFMDKINKHKVDCWLMNTGWSGEPYGSGDRVKIADSRALVKAVVTGQLENAEFEIDPIFQFEIPRSCPEVDQKMLNPRNVARDEGEYEMRANRLASDFMNDFSQFEDSVPESVREMLSTITLLEDSLDVLEQFKMTI